MYGFRVRHNGTVLAVALDDGVSGVIVDNKSGHFRIDVSGCDREGQANQWYASDIHPGDEIEVSFEDIPEDEIPPARILDYTRPENRKAKLIEAYYELKQELIDEGLL